MLYVHYVRQNELNFFFLNPLLTLNTANATLLPKQRRVPQVVYHKIYTLYTADQITVDHYCLFHEVAFIKEN